MVWREFLTGGFSAIILSALALAASGRPAHSTDVLDLAIPAGVADWSYEYRHQDALEAIGAGNAHRRGLDGRGSVVAVADTGFDLDHPDLVTRYVTGGYDLLDGDADPSPSGQGNNRSHGSHVAGIIAAEINGTGIVGVAPRAGIVPLRILPSSGAAIVDFSGTLDQAREAGADVLNNSWATRSSGDGIRRLRRAELAAAEAAVAADMLIVFSAGNEGRSQPSPESLVPIAQPALQSHWLAVTAVDASDRLLSYANQCGQAMQWCLAAPGHRILSAADGDDDALPNGYGVMSGTSMAAPHVSGALALLQQLFPELDAAQRADILLTSARDLGSPGIDPVYGHGMLDLESALRPIGPAAIPTGNRVNGTMSALASSRLGVDVGALGAMPVAFLDGYGRAYAVPLSGLSLGKPKGLKVRGILDGFGLGVKFDAWRMPGIGAVKYELSPVAIEDIDDAPTGTDALDDAQARMKIDAGFITSFGKVETGFNRSYSSRYGLSRAFGTGKASWLGKTAFDHPYLAATGKGFDVLIAPKMKPAGIRMEIGAVFGEAKYDEQARTMAASMAMTRPVSKSLYLTIQGGVMVEEDGIMGSKTAGAFAIRPTRTAFFGGGLGYKLDQQTALIAVAHAGRSSVRGDASLVEDGSISSSMLGLGIERRDTWRKDDVMQLSVTRPLKMRGGGLNLTVPVGRNGDVIEQQATRIGLSNGGEQIELQAGYALRLAKDMGIGIGAMARWQDSSSGGQIDGIGAIRANWRF